MHRLAHELNAIRPAIGVARYGSHARLKSVADEAARKDDLPWHALQAKFFNPDK